MLFLLAVVATVLTAARLEASASFGALGRRQLPVYIRHQASARCLGILWNGRAEGVAEATQRPSPRSKVKMKSLLESSEILGSYSLTASQSHSLSFNHLFLPLFRGCAIPGSRLPSNRVDRLVLEKSAMIQFVLMNRLRVLKAACLVACLGAGQVEHFLADHTGTVFD